MDRLASLGLMVAGVAHELNTPLGAAMLGIEKLETELANFKHAWSASSIRKSDVERLITESDLGLDLVSKNLARSAQIVRQFKQVAGDRAGAERREFNIREVLQDVMHLLERSLSKGVAKLELSVPDDIVLDSFPGALGQVLQNLVENAVLHGLPDAGGGHIKIEVINRDVTSLEILVISMNASILVLT